LSTASNTTCGWKTVRGGEPSFGTYDEYRLDMCNDGKRLNGNWRGIGAAGRRLGTRLAGGRAKPSFWTYDGYRLDICNRGKCLNVDFVIDAAGRRLGRRLVISVEYDLRVEDGLGR
jgi:hypothetical protein